ncbi:hypothetical protein [Pectobacterium sp. IFB5596]|uniref:hypothetical protein n=1 Tax=Pectobacterium sp. IFB5596 TaxID=1839803 RepID=UPI001F27832A|nr:hypothetical protein [Pectobacterium sp. IFB5596]
MTPENLKLYCRQLCKVVLCYADDAEVLELASGFEEIGSLMVNRNFGIAPMLTPEKRREYCIHGCKVVTRHATPNELIKLRIVIEVFVAKMLANNYRTGLNSVAYEVYNEYVLREKAINDIVAGQIDQMSKPNATRYEPRTGGHDHE